jgi:hypothetical protein
MNRRQESESRRRLRLNERSSCVELIPYSAERMVRVLPAPPTEDYVPVTAKLSSTSVMSWVRSCPERSEGFNAVQLAYRADLRELKRCPEQSEENSTSPGLTPSSSPAGSRLVRASSRGAQGSR